MLTGWSEALQVHLVWLTAVYSVSRMLQLKSSQSARNALTGVGMCAGMPQHMGGSPQLQMNGTSASAIHALPNSLPGQSSSSALTQKLAGIEDPDQRRTMLGTTAACQTMQGFLTTSSDQCVC